MKKSEIKAGHKYINESGSIREVIALGDYPLYPGQQDKDGVRYRLLSKGITGKTGSNLIGKEYNSTRIAFAHWAKGVIK